MTRLSRAYREATGLQERALNQALRELLLAQASDWPFMMKTGNAADFAEATFREHMGTAMRLFAQISAGSLQEKYLAYLEKKSPLFPDIDFRVFAGERGEKGEGRRSPL